AIPSLEERGTYEKGDVLSSGYGDSSYSDSYGDSSAGDSYDATPTMSSSPSATTHDVWVGGTAGLVYTPENIDAAVGDVVVFHYGTKNHTVTQSTFAEPCSPMAGGIATPYFN